MMTHRIPRKAAWLMMALLAAACQHAPERSYLDAPQVQTQRLQAEKDLLALLPPEQRGLPAACDEAHWLTETAYRGAVSIAALNDPLLWPAWMNNRLVNAPGNIRERGLCWHYQHDLFRELRRRPLQFFRLGCCVRDKGEGSEHNCVYVAACGQAWPHALVYDAWRKNGRLLVMRESDWKGEEWEDSPESAEFLASVYAEGHRYPVEHWAMVKGGRGWRDYVPSWSELGAHSRQGRLMQQNMNRGLEARGGRPTDY